MPLLMIVLLFGVMYFMMIRPQQKRRREAEQMQASLGPGDEIVTIGGLYGTVDRRRRRDRDCWRSRPACSPLRPAGHRPGGHPGGARGRAGHRGRGRRQGLTDPDRTGRRRCVSSTGTSNWIQPTPAWIPTAGVRVRACQPAWTPAPDPPPQRQRPTDAGRQDSRGTTSGTDAPRAAAGRARAHLRRPLPSGVLRRRCQRQLEGPARTASSVWTWSVAPG